MFLSLELEAAALLTTLARDFIHLLPHCNLNYFGYIYLETKKTASHAI